MQVKNLPDQSYNYNVEKEFQLVQDHPEVFSAGSLDCNPNIFKKIRIT